MASLAGGVQTSESGELLGQLDVGHRLGLDSSLDALHLRQRHLGSLTGPRTTKRDEKGAKPVVKQTVPSAANVGAFYQFSKRVLDILGSLIGLILLSPLMAISALLVKLSDGGPVLYPHIRVGKGGREFRCLKFRTMVVDADRIKTEIKHLNSHDDHRTFKVPDDPRVTRIGRLLRRSSIDEMPQLWNVLKGEMSLVGPRPPVPCEVEFYSLDDMQRLTVKPGMTCIWQVSGRSRHPFPMQLQLDLEYINQRNLWLDLKLLMQTLPAVVSADGAY